MGSPSTSMQLSVWHLQQIRVPPPLGWATEKDNLQDCVSFTGFFFPLIVPVWYNGAGKKTNQQPVHVAISLKIVQLGWGFSLYLPGWPC